MSQVRTDVFNLENELENIRIRTQAEIDKCDAFQIFYINHLTPGALPSYATDGVGYYVPNGGHDPQKVLGDELLCPPYPLGFSTDWLLNSDNKTIDNATQIFILGLIKKINNDAFNLLKYSGKDSDSPDWSKITYIYGTKKGVEKFLSKSYQLYTEQERIFVTKIVENDVGLDDNEIIGLSGDYKKHLFITIREKLSIWTDPTLDRQGREGFYGWLDLGFVNTGKNTCYYIDTNKI